MATWISPRIAAPLLFCLKCRRSRFDPWVGKIPWRRKQQPTPVFLLGESYGQRILAGYSPRGCPESDTTERLTISLSLVLLTDTSLCPLHGGLDISQPVGHQVSLPPSPPSTKALKSGSLSQSLSPWSQSQPQSFYPSQQPPDGTGHTPQSLSVERSHLKKNVGDFALLFPNLCGLLRLQPGIRGPSQPGPGVVSPGSAQCFTIPATSLLSSGLCS